MQSNDIKRNRPSDEDRDNDPQIRDESAAQPGVSTLSSSKNDAANQQLTRTGADDFDESIGNDGADPSFDEVEDKS